MPTNNRNIEVKTITIKRIVDKVMCSKNEEHIRILNEFLKEKPILTNYFIYEEQTMIGKRSYIKNILTNPLGPSSKNFHYHINIVDLTDECKITLSPFQVEMIEQVL